MKARVIAMYLPQYHPIKENDETWGKGFTEWTNVVQGRPLFRGHEQPKLPADLGFYDLRLPEIREQQAELARDAGIEGFMYWHYWMGGGKLLLEKPFEEVLKTKSPNFPFCLGWANHSWQTRTWKKQNVVFKDKMIVEQTYPGDEDIVQHFNYVLPAFRDSRYITVDGKPVFLIFAPFDIPNVQHFLKMWRDLAVQNGLKGVHFVGLRDGRTQKSSQLFEWGFDAVNNRSLGEAEDRVLGSVFLRKVKRFLSVKMGGATLQKFNYLDIIRNLGDDDNYKENVYPTIIPGYDRTARAGRRAVIYYNNTPQNFGEHVDRVMKYVEKKEDEHKIILLKSWNEWGEGNYMEPDLKYGHAYLDELKKRITE